jgi:hypothetical protein
MAERMAEPVRVERHLAISHKDFMRTLPAALGRRPDTEDPANILVKSGPDKRLEIRLSPEGSRQIGSLTLPQTGVALEFVGYTSQEIEQFMQRFDAYYRRGGG